METPWQSSAWCQDGPLKASAAARSLATDGDGHTHTLTEKESGRASKREGESARARASETEREQETKRAGQVNVALPAFPPAPFFLRPAPDQMSNKNSAKKSRDGTTSTFPLAEPPWTPRASPTTHVPASPPSPPRPRPTLPFAPARPAPSRDTPGPRGWRPQGPRAGRVAAGPERAARVPDCGSRFSLRRPARAGGGGYQYLSGLFPGPAAAQLQEPMSVRGARPLSREGGARIPGRGLGGPGSSSPFPCSPPGVWPGPDSASARPCAPPHTRAHTHSHSLARSHTRTPLPPPPLFISSSCLGTQEKPSTAPAPRSLRPRPAPHSRRLRYGDSVRRFPEWLAGPLPRPARPVNVCCRRCLLTC